MTRLPGFRLSLCLVVAFSVRPCFAGTPPESNLNDSILPEATFQTPQSGDLPPHTAGDPATIRYEPAETVPPQAIVTHGIVYDDGWTLRPYNPDSTPFQLKISFQNQSRYTNLSSEQDSVATSTGLALSTPDRNSFDINRGRLIFSGYAFAPEFEYYLNIDYNTVTDQPTQVLLAWINYRFSERLSAGYGLGKLPGTWEWHSAARYVQGADRSMATTFFRPSITAGVWTECEVLPRLRYRAMIGNGFNTFALSASDLDTNFAYSGILWWEPRGDFGPGFSDLERHPEAVLRVGQSFTFSRQDATPAGDSGPEQAAVRLSDGARLVAPGALTPGVTVSRFDISVCAAHAGWKHNGYSLSSECFFRWLTDLGADGPLPVGSIYDRGFLLQGGAFLGDRPVELFARGSAVYGPFGDGSELGGGCNWFPTRSRNLQVTGDVVHLEDCPAQQDRTGYVAGVSGFLCRFQVFTSF